MRVMKNGSNMCLGHNGMKEFLIICDQVNFSHENEQTQDCFLSPKGAGPWWNPCDTDTGNEMNDQWESLFLNRLWPEQQSYLWLHLLRQHIELRAVGVLVSVFKHLVGDPHRAAVHLLDSHIFTDCRIKQTRLNTHPHLLHKSSFNPPLLFCAQCHCCSFSSLLTFLSLSQFVLLCYEF